MSELKVGDLVKVVKFGEIVDDPSMCRQTELQGKLLKVKQVSPVDHDGHVFVEISLADNPKYTRNLHIWRLVPAFVGLNRRKR